MPITAATILGPVASDETPLVTATEESAPTAPASTSVVSSSGGETAPVTLTLTAAPPPVVSSTATIQARGVVKHDSGDTDSMPITREALEKRNEATNLDGGRMAQSLGKRHEVVGLEGESFETDPQSLGKQTGDDTGTSQDTLTCAPLFLILSRSL